MRILHFIDSLDYGGAETLLMTYIPLLPDDEHVVVTLRGPNVYQKGNYEYINLALEPLMGRLRAVLAVRRIINAKRIDIVHSHSYWTNIISRLAVKSKVKLINHYHFADYDTMKDKGAVKKMVMLDRMTNRKKLVRVAVSEYVARILNDNFPGANVKVIPNFIECRPVMPVKDNTDREQVRVVAVGNCNLEKNYAVVLEAFESLKSEPVRIDIIGGGRRLDYYRAEAVRLGLDKVQFCGKISNAREHLPNYDLFLSASISETFGIAVLEGVCAKLPLLISDIPAFNEIAPRDSLFFNPFDKNDLVKHLKQFVRDRRKIDTEDYDRVLKKYSGQTFLMQLKGLYNN